MEVISSNTMKNILSGICFNFLNLEELQILSQVKGIIFPLQFLFQSLLHTHKCIVLLFCFCILLVLLVL